MKTATDRHADLVEQTASSYRDRGYDVVSLPDGGDHGWTAPFVPDLLARNEAETVVIEITSRGGLRRPGVREFTEEMEDRPGWRFSVVLDDGVDDEPPPPARVPRPDVDAGLEVAEALRDQGEPALAAMLSASLLEALLREGAHRLDVDVSDKAGRTVLTTGASLGYLDDDQHMHVLEAWRTRSAVAHGLLPPDDGSTADEAAEILIAAARAVAAALDADLAQPVE
jgi:hypothetical protein